MCSLQNHFFAESEGRPNPAPAGGIGLLALSRAAAIHDVGEQRKNREIEDGVDADGNAQKPAEGPGQRFVYGGCEELCNFEAGRHKENERDWQGGFAGARPHQREKPHQESEYGGKNPAEQWTLRHSHEFYQKACRMVVVA